MFDRLGPNLWEAWDTNSLAIGSNMFTKFYYNDISTLSTQYTKVIIYQYDNMVVVNY